MAQKLSQILNSVRPDGWTQKLNKIKEHIKTFDELRTIPSQYNRNEILEHLNEILPTYWEVFHTHNTYRRTRGELQKRGEDETQLPLYHIGIFLVGYSSIPIALSLAEIQPTEQIYFLYSSDTKDYLNEIFDRLSAQLNNSNKDLLDLAANTVLCNLEESSLIIDDPSDPVATFKRIKEIVDNTDNSDSKRIALDLTGGKKTMLGGGYTAGAIWTSKWSEEAKKSEPFCDMYYVDSKQYDPNRGSPVPGTEFLSQLVNPYDVYNVQSNMQAHKLFEKHNYEAAVNLWEDVEKTLETHATQYGLDSEKELTKSQRKLAQCYYLWDSFDYVRAKNMKNRNGTSWGYNDKHVKNSIDVLSILSQVKNRSSLFAQEDRIIHYAVDRYQNAMRRKYSGKLDDAIVRFTQVIEMLCHYQAYLLREGNCFNNIGETKEKVIRPQYLNIGLIPLIRLLFGIGTIKVGSDSYSVQADKKLNPNSFGCASVDDIINVIQPRHDFIHFNNRMNQSQTKTNTEKLQLLAREFLNYFSSDYYNKNKITLDDLLELHRFRQ